MRITRNFIFLSLLLFWSCQDDPRPEVVVPVEADRNELSEFLIQQQPSSDMEKRRLAKNLGAADFVPLGLMIKPGETISVSAALLAGTNRPTLLMGTYSRNDWTYTPAEFTIRDGSQQFTNPTAEDQLLYIRYTGSKTDQEIEVTVEGGWKVPFFELGVTDNASFREQLETFKSYVDIQLMSRRGIIVLARNIALKYKNQDWEDLLTTLDEVVDMEEYISGLDGSSELHAPTGNRYLLTQTRDSRYWMAATNYRTFYNSVDAIDFVASKDKLFGDGWGPWHEIGHQHQLSAITWNETVEVTVNIYSLAVERKFGHESRLKRENRWPAIMEYLSRPEKEKDFNDSALGPFLRLGLYQQLWLAYGDDFLIRLHQQIREEDVSPQSREAKMGYLMLTSSKVAGEDLSGFYRAWGFEIDDIYYQAIHDLALPEPPVPVESFRE